MKLKKYGYFCLRRPETFLVKRFLDFQKLFTIVAIPLGIVLGILGLLTFSGCKKGKLEAADYNLLVITLDTTRADRLGAYGYKTAQTPNLDSLAQKGVMFQQCYTPVPLTLAAHCSIFSGQYPLAHHVRGNGLYMLSQDTDTLAEQMKKNGYQTFAVIGSFVLLGKFGLNQGFDLYDDTLNSHVMYNNYDSEIPASMVYSKFQQWFTKNHQQKFFAWVHFYDPHKPYNAPREYQEKFKDDNEGRYDAELAFTDEYVGKVIDTLKSARVLENTLVIIVGDHGEAFGEHLEYGHGIFCYEESMKVPLIFYNPRLLPNPLQVKTRVDLVDLMPTILELYKLEIPKGNQGKSMIHLLAGQEETSPRELYFESMYGKDELNFAPLMGVIAEQYKYISLPEPELYDLEKDPLEKDNLFLKKNRLAREMDRKLMKLVGEYSTTGADTRRELSEEDKKHLQTLGYVSSFTNQANPNMDPKKGIVLANDARQIFNDVEKGKLAGGEKELEELISRFPEDSSIIFELKYRLYSLKKDKKMALEVLKEAMKKYPKVELFFIYYTLETYGAGMIAEAETTCRKVLELNPRFTRAYIILGEIEEKRGNIKKARDHFKSALEIEPRNISLQLKYADLLIMEKEYQEALGIYDEVLRRDEVAADPELLFKIALFNLQFGNLDKSAQLLKKAIGIKPNGKYYFTYALVLSKNKKIGEALQNIKIALEKYRSDLSDQQAQVAQKAITLWTPGQGSQ
jgi:arylsulfatase A-like enzyme/Tfp pilus assembly protein PilF